MFVLALRQLMLPAGVVLQKFSYLSTWKYIPERFFQNIHTQNIF